MTETMPQPDNLDAVFAQNLELVNRLPDASYDAISCTWEPEIDLSDDAEAMIHTVFTGPDLGENERAVVTHLLTDLKTGPQMGDRFVLVNPNNPYQTVPAATFAHTGSVERGWEGRVGDQTVYVIHRRTMLDQFDASSTFDHTLYVTKVAPEWIEDWKHNKAINNDKHSRYDKPA